MASAPGHSKAFDASDFVAAIKAHEEFVHGRSGGTRADLRFIKAPGIDLSKRRLDDIELSGADLSDANLSEANLSRASLNCTNITRANCAGANLSRADLRGCRLQGVNFESANMDGADFRQSTIAVTDKSGKWAILGGGDGGFFVSFANCSLKRARLNNANLKNAKFDGALLNGASFAGASLDNASFDGAVLVGVRLADLRVPPERLQNCITDPSPELQARLPRYIEMLEDAQKWAETAGRQGRPASFAGEDIRLLAQHMKQRVLTGINLAKTIAVNTDFTNCELQAAKFDFADLRGATFKGADVRGASFRGSNLAHVDFSDAKLTPLRLEDGAQMPTVFEGALLDGAVFSKGRSAS